MGSTVHIFLIHIIAKHFFKNPCPEETASFLSRTFFAWFDRLALKGFRKPLEASDLWDMNPEDSCREIVPKFEKHWNRTLRSRNG